jgi:hypothetical protein
MESLLSKICSSRVDRSSSPNSPRFLSTPHQRPRFRGYPPQYTSSSSTHERLVCHVRQIEIPRWRFLAPSAWDLGFGCLQNCHLFLALQWERCLISGVHILIRNQLLSSLLAIHYLGLRITTTSLHASCRSSLPAVNLLHWSSITTSLTCMLHYVSGTARVDLDGISTWFT